MSALIYDSLRDSQVSRNRGQAVDLHEQTGCHVPSDICRFVFVPKEKERKWSDGLLRGDCSCKIELWKHDMNGTYDNGMPKPRLYKISSKMDMSIEE